MNQRLKEVREKLGLSQRDFAKRTDIGQSTLAMFETGSRIPKDIHINRICQEFNINEEWLRTGEGDMFFKPKVNDLVSRAAKLLGEKDPVFEAFVETYSKLDPRNREILLNFGMDFLKCLNARNNN